MKHLRAIVVLGIISATSTVLAGPTAAPAAGTVAPAAGTVAAPARAVSSKGPLTVVRTTEAEAGRAKDYSFKPAHVVQAIREDQTDGPSLFAGRVGTKPQPPQPKLNVAKFGEMVHDAFKQSVRGYALGLRKGGQPILTLIWDWARTPAQGAKGWTLDTRMHVASVSKLMTAIVATKMLDERGLSFDTKIGNYLPVYWKEGQNANDITFRELLRHQAAFTIYDGDFLSFKKQIEQGVSSNPADGIGYTNGSFSLVRVLNATMTGAVSKNAKFASPLPFIDQDLFNDIMWDHKATQAFLAYAQQKVFTPAGVTNVSAEPTASGALAYAGKTDTAGWNSGDLDTQLGGAGFRLSVNDVLDVMGTFRRKGTIVSPPKAKDAIDAMLGLDQAIDTPLGKIYNKNGAWRTGASATADIEQSVAYFLQEDMECVVLVNSWIGQQQASLRNTIKDAYLANIE